MSHKRESQRKEIFELLEAGHSINMLAPRRIGKTWLMKTVKQDLVERGWNAILIDVEGLQTEADFLRALCEEIESSVELKTRIWAQLSQRMKQVLGTDDSGSLADAAQKVEPRTFLETLIESLSLAGKNTVILIDEIALFVLAMAKVDVDGTQALLYHLRKLQQKFSTVRWFLTGSVGLDSVAKRHNLLGAFLDYTVYELEPFNRGEARSYAISDEVQSIPSRRFTFSEDSFTYLVEQLGWLSPYYLRLIVQNVKISTSDSGSRKNPEATPADIEAAISRLLQPQFRPYFSAWEEHLNKNFPPVDSKRLYDVLEALVKKPDGETNATIMSRVSINGQETSPRVLREDLLALAADGFIDKDGDRWRFRSGLLRRYWMEYVVT